jgi:4-hydroxy-3-methylbut-2-en-1-yl diphosphate reductase
MVCTALGLESWLVRRRAAGLDVRCTGYGPYRAARAARVLRRRRFPVLVVAGFGGALVPGIEPGDIVVASEVRPGPVACPWALGIANLLRCNGFTVHEGPVVTSPVAVYGRERSRLAARGAIAVDMESEPLVAAAGKRPFAVVRVVVDTPARSLISPATFSGGWAAARVLGRLGPTLSRWAAYAADLEESTP